MKKFINAAMALALAISVSVPTFAVEDFGVEQTMPGQGYIGIDKETDLSSLVDLTLPSNFEWAVTEISPEVKSGEYTIKNNSRNVTLGVTLVSFEQTNANTVPLTGLTLNLTGDLAEGQIGQNVIGYSGNTPYTKNLEPESEWTYGFSGTYTGSIPVPALQPEYSMVLNFNVLNVSTTPQGN